MRTRGLGRRHAPDQRDERFLIRSVLPAAEPGRTYRYWWPSGWWGDQLRTPQCVAYAWLHFVEDGPITHAPRAAGAGPVLDPAWVYREAQKIDEWPGENYDGTSVRAGVKVLQRRGLVGSYRWGWTLADLIDAVLQLGPVVAGTWWYSGMWQPDAEGFIHATGRREGGHAYLINGANVKRGVFRLKNSWGRGWGRDGHAWIGFEDMEQLIHEHGEVCIAEERVPAETTADGAATDTGEDTMALRYRVAHGFTASTGQYMTNDHEDEIKKLPRKERDHHIGRGNLVEWDDSEAAAPPPATTETKES